MSKNRNRAKLNKAKTNSQYNKLLINMEYPAYWDDGLAQYPNWRKGYKNPCKRIFYQQVREYRTWKYNRQTKWKIRNDYWGIADKGESPHK